MLNVIQPKTAKKGKTNVMSLGRILGFQNFRTRPRSNTACSGLNRGWLDDDFHFPKIFAEQRDR
jgi:hypothetical protein